MNKKGLVKESFSEYQKSDGVNQSFLKDVVINPRRLKIEKDSPNLRFGRIFHEYLLEPEYFKESYIVLSGDRRTKEYKQACKEFHTSKIVHTKEMEQMEQMEVGVKRNSLASKLLNEATDIEQSVYWEDPDYGFQCKGRLDMVSTVGKSVVISDLKTTEDADLFIKSAYFWSYDLQAAFYKRGMETLGYDVDGIYFIVSEKKQTQDCIVYTAKPSFVEKGEAKLQKYLGELIVLGNTGRESYAEERELY